LSHNSRCLHFALPEKAEPRSLVVYWPSGLVQKLDASSLAGQVTLVEGDSEDEAAPRFFVRKEFK
jgi:hypothetical protein